MSFVDAHRGELGVEPVCTALGVAPSTYYAAKHRQRLPSARAVSDAVWMPVLSALWVANRKVCDQGRPARGSRDRPGPGRPADAPAGRTRRQRRRKMSATRRDPGCGRLTSSPRIGDALWVTDLTYVATRAGMAYVCRRGRVLPSWGGASLRTCAPRWSSTGRASCGRPPDARVTRSAGTRTGSPG